MNKKRFTLTEDHVKLIRRMYVSWCGDEYGAPEINPKRPYGNSDVTSDIAQILGWVDIEGMDEETQDEFYEGSEYEQLCERAETIHRETEAALSVVLATGSFVPGVYQSDAYSDDWELVDFP